jgi:hypothetical protein
MACKRMKAMTDIESPVRANMKAIGAASAVIMKTTAATSKIAPIASAR